MTRGRYILAVILVAATGAGFSYWSKQPAPEEPAPGSGSGILDLRSEDTIKSLEVTSPPAAAPAPAQGR